MQEGNQKSEKKNSTSATVSFGRPNMSVVVCVISGLGLLHVAVQKKVVWQNGKKPRSFLLLSFHGSHPGKKSGSDPGHSLDEH
jgi:hypothetical protein